MHDPNGLSNLIQRMVCLACPSESNLHKVKHNFRDTLNPMCPTNDGMEDTENPPPRSPGKYKHFDIPMFQMRS